MGKLQSEDQKAKKGKEHSRKVPNRERKMIEAWEKEKGKKAEEEAERRGKNRKESDSLSNA